MARTRPTIFEEMDVEPIITDDGYINHEGMRRMKEEFYQEIGPKAEVSRAKLRDPKAVYVYDDVDVAFLWWTRLEIDLGDYKPETLRAAADYKEIKRRFEVQEKKDTS